MLCERSSLGVNLPCLVPSQQSLARRRSPSRRALLHYQRTHMAWRRAKKAASRGAGGAVFIRKNMHLAPTVPEPLCFYSVTELPHGGSDFYVYPLCIPYVYPFLEPPPLMYRFVFWHGAAYSLNHGNNQFRHRLADGVWDATCLQTCQELFLLVASNSSNPFLTQ